MLGDQRERAIGMRLRVEAPVVEVERGAVVDQPQPVVPDQQVRVARGAVDVRGERVEPHDVGRQAGIGAPRPARRVGQRAGQEVHAQVRAGAAA